jgi:Transposase DDE domain
MNINIGNTLRTIMRYFEKILPSEDGRTAVSPFKFVAAFIFSLVADTKTPSLEELRREMIARLEISLSRSSFWERLSRKRLVNFLEQILSALMGQLNVPAVSGQTILTQLEIIGIYIVDSTSIRLPAWASKYFPGTGSAAAVKWHTCIDVMQGILRWNQITAGRVHDSNCFPDIKDLIGRLVIFDLGYWSYELLQLIDTAGGFYLSRLRSDAVIIIREVVQGLNKKFINTPLLKVPSQRKKSTIIEVYCEHIGKEANIMLRVIGFWNPIEQRYHWYVTNLKIAAIAIYPLYRLRWQIELMFKGCKQSLKLDNITTGNKNIIESLLLGTLIAQLCSQTILRNSLDKLTEEQKFAVSYQRISMVFVRLAPRVISFLLNKHKNSLDRLLRAIDVFIWELFDPNYLRRRSSLAQINDVLNAQL